MSRAALAVARAVLARHARGPAVLVSIGAFFALLTALPGTVGLDHGAACRQIAAWSVAAGNALLLVAAVALPAAMATRGRDLSAVRTAGPRAFLAGHLAAHAVVLFVLASAFGTMSFVWMRVERGTPDRAVPEPPLRALLAQNDARALLRAGGTPLALQGALPPAPPPYLRVRVSARVVPVGEAHGVPAVDLAWTVDGGRIHRDHQVLSAAGDLDTTLSLGEHPVPGAQVRLLVTMTDSRSVLRVPPGGVAVVAGRVPVLPNLMRAFWCSACAAVMLAGLTAWWMMFVSAPIAIAASLTLAAVWEMAGADALAAVVPGGWRSWDASAVLQGGHGVGWHLVAAAAVPALLLGVLTVLAAVTPPRTGTRR